MNSMMLNADTPKNSPSKPPQIARKSVYVYFSMRFVVITLSSLKVMNNFDGVELKWKLVS